jgi:hypothetical protein
LADVNCDGIVDGADDNIILGNLGMTGATLANGDVDGDGDVDGADFDLWQLTLGIRWTKVS